ncbi:hypothetical protein BKA69DRAFT_16822 [Paraphysoderma sedebokerense]|nr:hypothetical protein BKA69DRAFT_16822 [Paraphysoderma sedebokerense]
MRKPKEPTAHPTSAPTPSGAPWNSDEDDFLLKNAKEYQFNWELVADALNLQLKKGSMIRNDRRSPLECQQRYHKIESQSSGSQAQNHLSQVIQNASSSSTPNLAPSPKTRKESREAFLSQKAIKDGVKKRRIKHYSILDVIRRLAPDRNKHKTQQANPPNSQNATPEKIPMAPSPFELSELKFRRDEQLRKLQLERERQAQLAAAGSARVVRQWHCLLECSLSLHNLRD